MGALGDGDDSDEEDDGDSDERDRGTADGGGGGRSRPVEAAGGNGGPRTGGRMKIRMPAECPFDREEILGIWSRYASELFRFSCTTRTHVQ